MQAVWIEIAFGHLSINAGMDLTNHWDWIFYPDWPAAYSNSTFSVSSPNSSVNVFYRLYLHLTSNTPIEVLHKQPRNITSKLCRNEKKITNRFHKT